MTALVLPLAILFTLDPATTVQFVVAVLLPILVGLVTKRTTSGAWKAVLLALLSLATSVLTGLGDALTAGTDYDLGAALFLALPTFAVAVATYFGLWKPIGVTEKAQGALVSDGSVYEQQATVEGRRFLDADGDGIPDTRDY